MAKKDKDQEEYEKGKNGRKSASAKLQRDAGK